MSARPSNLFWNRSSIAPEARRLRYGQEGRIVWFTGLSGSGKSTLATDLERRLFARGRHVYLLDGDNLRHGLCSDLGFSPADRSENIRRAAEVAKLFADAGFICIAAFISPLRADRDRARSLVPPGRFVEVHVHAPIDVCRQRDPKGLYARADRGELEQFTGVSSPYEPPFSPEVVLHTDQHDVETCVSHLLHHLEPVSPQPLNAS